MRVSGKDVRIQVWRPGKDGVESGSFQSVAWGMASLQQSRGDLLPRKPLLVFLPMQGFDGIRGVELGELFDYYADQDQDALLDFLQAFEDRGVFAIQIPIVEQHLVVDPPRLELVVADDRATSRHYLSNKEIRISADSNQASTLMNGFSLFAIDNEQAIRNCGYGFTDVCMGDLVLLIPEDLLYQESFSLEELVLTSNDIFGALKQYERRLASILESGQKQSPISWDMRYP